MVTSCGDKKNKKESDSPFTSFISSLDKVELPFHYDLVAQDIENCSKPALADTLFIQAQDYIIGLLPDTLDNYKVLYLRTGDDFYPSLKVFAKNGRLLSDNLICFPECSGVDCEVDSCYSYVNISSKDISRRIKTIFTSCDSVGNKISGSTNYKVRQEYIQVNQSGNLDIVEELIF